MPPVHRLLHITLDTTHEGEGADEPVGLLREEAEDVHEEVVDDPLLEPHEPPKEPHHVARHHPGAVSYTHLTLPTKA